MLLISSCLLCGCIAFVDENDNVKSSFIMKKQMAEDVFTLSKDKSDNEKHELFPSKEKKVNNEAGK